MLNINKLTGISKNSNTELESITHEKGIKELNRGNSNIDGSNGTSIASAIIAFASAPPKISRNWKKIYMRAIMIGMKIR